MTNQTKRSRLRLIIASSVLATVATLSLIYVLWPASNTQETEVKNSRAPKASVPRIAVPSGNVLGNAATRTAAEPGRPVSPAIGTAVGQQPPQHKPLVVPPHTEANIIKAPLPWMRNGPPVRTPMPGATSSPQSPRTGSAAPPILPNGMTRNARGQTLPYLPPAHKMPDPLPKNDAPPAN